MVQQPIVGNFDETMAVDPAIRSTSEGGYTTSRARFTRLTRKWTIHYEWTTTVNKDAIKVFETARVGGSESFTWTNPMDSTAYTVRFLGLIRYTAHTNTNFTRWMLDFVLEAV